MPNNTKANRRYGRPPYAAVCLLENLMGVSMFAYEKTVKIKWINDKREKGDVQWLFSYTFLQTYTLIYFKTIFQISNPFFNRFHQNKLLA